MAKNNKATTSSDEKNALKAIEVAKNKRKSITAVGKRGKDPNLLAISDALDRYYFLDKLRIYCAYLSYRNITNPDKISYSAQNFKLIDEILVLIEKVPFQDMLLYHYNRIRKLHETIPRITEPDDELYEETLRLIKEDIDEIMPDDLEELYSLLSNYCIYWMNKGEKRYIRRYFLISNDLINLQFNKGSKKQLNFPGSMFKNMIINALMLKSSDVFKYVKTNGVELDDENKGFNNAFEWIEKFIAFYGKYITENSPLYISYCKALMEFERGNFSRAYKILQNPTHKRGTFLNMDIKVLNLKIVYEIFITKPRLLKFDQIEIEKLLEAYRGLIRDEQKRKKELNYQLDFYLTFEKLFRQLLQFQKKYMGLLYNKKNEKFIRDKNDLSNQIDQVEYAYKDWFVEKMDLIK